MYFRMRSLLQKVLAEERCIRNRKCQKLEEQDLTAGFRKSQLSARVTRSIIPTITEVKKTITATLPTMRSLVGLVIDHDLLHALLA